MLWLALVSLIALSSPETVQAGCSTATGPLHLSTVHVHPLRLLIAFEHIAQDRLRAGTDKVTFRQITRPNHDEIETIKRNFLLCLDYNFTGRFSTTLSLPIVQRRHAHIAVAGHDHGEHKHWLFHASGHYPIDERFDLLGQFVSTWADRDEAGSTGEYTDATGGTRLYFSPGLRYRLRGLMALYSYYQYPIYEDLNQVQLTADRNLLFGCDYELDLFY